MNDLIKKFIDIEMIHMLDLSDFKGILVLIKGVA